ncbi:hypothetical protein GIB67_023032, partial [Kingdonia uniflora]
GPDYGYQGQVLLTFEENGSSKIGVRFDKAISDANDLGGLCEKDHADSLRSETLEGDDADIVAFKELFEEPILMAIVPFSFSWFFLNFHLSQVVSSESRKGALILFMKNIEKSVITNPDALYVIKSKFENLPENVVIIGSHTQLDNRKEKTHPGGLLFTKFGINPTALVDLNFPGTSIDLVESKSVADAESKSTHRWFMPRDWASSREVITPIISVEKAGAGCQYQSHKQQHIFQLGSLIQEDL